MLSHEDNRKGCSNGLGKKGREKNTISPHHNLHPLKTKILNLQPPDLMQVTRRAVLVLLPPLVEGLVLVGYGLVHRVTCLHNLVPPPP